MDDDLDYYFVNEYGTALQFSPNSSYIVTAPKGKVVERADFLAPGENYSLGVIDMKDLLFRDEF